MGQAKIKVKNLIKNFNPNYEKVREVFLLQQDHLQCCEPGDRCLKYKELTDLTPAEKAIKEIQARSFSGRNPELGKMINCHCGRRHRESEKHDMKYIAEAGKTPATESLIEERRIRLVLGAAMFKGKRRKPPLNKRANEFVQVVYSLVPDIYTHEELEQARRKAKRILAKKYGRHGFLPPVWQKQRKDDKTETSVQSV